VSKRLVNAKFVPSNSLGLSEKSKIWVPLSSFTHK
jgi:hypothetical protein